MNLELRSLFDLIAKAPGRTKLVFALGALALIAAVAIGGWISGRPHFVTLYSGLDDQERVAVEKALAGATVTYRVSQPPGPYVVYVNEAQFDQAQIAVALGEGLKQATQGIESSAAGPAAIFMSAGERAQSMQKREWQEAERLLERLEFVSSATVTTSMPDSSPLRERKPVMVSVALELRGAAVLTPEQARNVAKLVMHRFGAPPENVVITDANGRTLYDPGSLDNGRKDVADLLEHSSSYDKALAAKALAQIEAAFGPRKAVVTVTSQWNYDQSTTIDEKLDPEAVAVETESKSTTAPGGGQGGVGGAAGVPANAAGFGNENAAVNGGGGGAGVAKTLDERKSFETSRQRTQTVRSTPRLEKLFVALVLDESLAAKQAELQRIVEAAVGFDKSRQDVIGVTTTAFAAEAATATEGQGEDGAATATSADPGPNRMLEMLLERGVEIVSALAFLLLLFTSLKGAKKSAATAGGGAGAIGGGLAAAGARTGAAGGDGGELSIDPEVLARAQIEELVKSDPRRVGEILSRWVDEKATAKV